MPLSLAVSGNALNMTLTKGESMSLAVTVTDSDTGLPVDITGYSVKFRAAFPTPLELDTTLGGVSLTNPTQGVCQVTLTDAQSEALVPGNYAHEFWTVSPSGESVQRFYGTFTLLQSMMPIP